MPDDAAEDERDQALAADRAERVRELVLARPWATARDLEGIERILQLSRPGETWAEFVERIVMLESRWHQDGQLSRPASPCRTPIG